MIVLKTLVFTLLVPGTVLLYLLWKIMAPAPPTFSGVPGALRAIAIGPFILYEEPTLRKKFGEPYERYRASVARWIPRVPGSAD